MSIDYLCTSPAAHTADTAPVEDAEKMAQERAPHHDTCGQPRSERELNPERIFRRPRLATLDNDIRPQKTVPEFCDSLPAAPLSRAAKDQRGYIPNLQARPRRQVHNSSQERVNAQKIIEWRNRNLVDTQGDRQHSITATGNIALFIDNVQDLSTIDKVASEALGKDQSRLKLTAPDLKIPNKDRYDPIDTACLEIGMNKNTLAACEALPHDVDPVTEATSSRLKRVSAGFHEAGSGDFPPRKQQKLSCVINTTLIIVQPIGHDTALTTAAATSKLTPDCQRHPSADAALGTKRHCTEQCLDVDQMRSNRPGEGQGDLVEPAESDRTTQDDGDNLNRSERMLQSDREENCEPARDAENQAMTQKRGDVDAANDQFTIQQIFTAKTKTNEGIPIMNPTVKPSMIDTEMMSITDKDKPLTVSYESIWTANRNSGPEEKNPRRVSAPCSNDANPNCVTSTSTVELAKPYTCTTCARFYKRSDHFKRHERTHTNPFQRPDCPTCFSNREHSTQHEL